MFTVRSIRKFAAAVGMALVFVTSASAATILSVAPGATDTPLALGPNVPNAGAAAGFTLGANYSNVSISIDFTCLSCAGDIILFQGPIGPSAAASGITAVGTFDASSSTIGLNNITSLNSGNYFLVVDVTAGGLIWSGSSAPSFTTDGLSFNGADFIIDQLNLTSAVLSTFLPANGFFHFDITGDLVAADPNATVPLPGAAVLFLAGLGFLSRLRRRRV